MEKLVYICGTSVLAAVAILVWLENTPVSSRAASAPVPVISQGSLPAGDASSNRPLPVEQWDAF